ncbi:MAG: hypothetical protein JW723_09185 [Bacteroidales bacterium]|nr:hypothetical protein [Bacteroidales bacterium]
MEAGLRNLTGSECIVYIGFWWSSTEASAEDANSPGSANPNGQLYLNDLPGKTGMSVHFVREVTAGL